MFIGNKVITSCNVVLEPKKSNVQSTKYFTDDIDTENEKLVSSKLPALKINNETNEISDAEGFKDANKEEDFIDAENVSLENKNEDLEDSKLTKRSKRIKIKPKYLNAYVLLKKSRISKKH